MLSLQDQDVQLSQIEDLLIPWLQYRGSDEFTMIP